jgi:hypothetical protein
VKHIGEYGGVGRGWLRHLPHPHRFLSLFIAQQFAKYSGEKFLKFFKKGVALFFRVVFCKKKFWKKKIQFFRKLFSFIFVSWFL